MSVHLCVPECHYIVCVCVIAHRLRWVCEIMCDCVSAFVCGALVTLQWTHTSFHQLALAILLAWPNHAGGRAWLILDAFAGFVREEKKVPVQTVTCKKQQEVPGILSEMLLLPGTIP